MRKRWCIDDYMMELYDPAPAERTSMINYFEISEEKPERLTFYQLELPGQKDRRNAIGVLDIGYFIFTNSDLNPTIILTASDEMEAFEKFLRYEKLIPL